MTPLAFPVQLLSTSVGLGLVAIALLGVHVARLHKRIKDQDERIMNWQASMRLLYTQTERALLHSVRERALWERPTTP
jgi:hypothetical protein